MKTKPSRLSHINFPFKANSDRFWCLAVQLSLIFCIGIALQLNVNTIFAYSGGPPDGRTGSPADSLKTCNDTSCHNNYALNSGIATFSISAPSSYTLGETLSITVSFSNSNTAKHGFELSALDANKASVGTFTNVDSNTQRKGRLRNTNHGYKP